jgi:hypothetical protein
MQGSKFNKFIQIGLIGPDPNWRVSRVVDYNAECKADLTWPSNGGSITIWLMNGHGDQRDGNSGAESLEHGAAAAVVTANRKPQY